MESAGATLDRALPEQVGTFSTPGEKPAPASAPEVSGHAQSNCAGRWVWNVVEDLSSAVVFSVFVCVPIYPAAFLMRSLLFTPTVCVCMRVDSSHGAEACCLCLHTGTSATFDILRVLACSRPHARVCWSVSSTHRARRARRGVGVGGTATHTTQADTSRKRCCPAAARQRRLRPWYN